jgi:thiamine kinase-like enzyme
MGNTLSLAQRERIFSQCQAVFPAWRAYSANDFSWDAPKGFSSFTLGIRAKHPLDPPAVLYRQLEGKENAILDFETEKRVFLELGTQDIAARCYHYDATARFEAFYFGRTLRSEELFQPETLRKIAHELYRFHQLKPSGLPEASLFELIHKKWGALAKQVLENHLDAFPPEERPLAEELRGLYSPELFSRIQAALPKGPLTFCHNDTYHGNIMRLENGALKLLDFEFSCLNHKVYDFSNLFAETVMQHQQPEYPYFRIAEPAFGDYEIGILLNAYLGYAQFDSSEARAGEFTRLLTQTKQMLKFSDYKYALAAIPLALAPIQKIRFIPYAYQRYQRFLQALEADEAQR